MNAKSLLDSLLGFEPHEYTPFHTFEFAETGEVAPYSHKVSPKDKPYFKKRVKKVFDIDIEDEKSITFYQNFSHEKTGLFGYYALCIVVGDTTRYIRQKNVLDFKSVSEYVAEEGGGGFDYLTTVTFVKNGAKYKYGEIVYCVDSVMYHSLSKCICQTPENCCGHSGCVYGHFFNQIDYPILDVVNEPLIVETQIDFEETLEKILSGGYDLEHGESVTVTLGATPGEVWNYKYPARATITTGDREYLAKRLKETFGIDLGDETSVTFSPDTSGWHYSVPEFHRTKDYDGLYAVVGSRPPGYIRK